MDSRIMFVNDGVRKPITAVSGVWLQAASRGGGWEGLQLEVGLTKGNAGSALLANGHMVSMNPTDTPVPVYLRDQLNMSWLPRLHQPGTFLIYPEGCPIWVLCPQPSQWSTAIITSAYLDARFGGPLELGMAINVEDPVLRHLFCALIEESKHPSPREISTRSLVGSFVTSLGCRLGRHAPSAMKDELTPGQLAKAAAWIKRHLGANITVGGLAAELGIPQQLFSRTFKHTTGVSPWEYVVELRLQRAREMLEGGNTVCSVAFECGFSDQAHLSRLFKRRFDVSPASFAKRGRYGLISA